MSKISVIIPCKDDPAVLDCVKSIDYLAQAIVVFNGSDRKFISNVKRELKGENVLYEELPEPNLACALEYGIQKSPTDWVLLMDSDCLFEKGAVKSFENFMEDGNPDEQVFKGQVQFAKGNNWFSKIISKSRQHHTAEELTAYKPPLALSRSIRRKIGGHIFNKDLIWREDADLDHRIRQAKIEIKSVEGGLIHHKALNAKSDLRSTFRYGLGEAIADKLGLKLTDVPRSVKSTFKSQGMLPAIYMLIRNRIYTVGYLYGKIKYRKES